MSSSLSSSSLGKILYASNQVTKKKKKGKKKKRLDNKVFNQPTMVVSIGIVEGTSTMHHTPKYTCKLCKGDHFLINCSGIPKVFEVWSNNSYQLTVDLSTSDSQILRENIKVTFHFRLCKGTHHSHLFPHMDEAS